MARIYRQLCLVIAVILFSGCAERFHGIPVSPTDCRNSQGVHVACPDASPFFLI